MKRLFLFKAGVERWIGESPCLPGRYLLGNSRDEVLERLRAQIRDHIYELKEARCPVVEDESELLIVSL